MVSLMPFYKKKSDSCRFDYFLWQLYLSCTIWQLSEYACYIVSQNDYNTKNLSQKMYSIDKKMLWSPDGATYSLHYELILCLKSFINFSSNNDLKCAIFWVPCRCKHRYFWESTCQTRLRPATKKELFTPKLSPQWTPKSPNMGVYFNYFFGCLSGPLYQRCCLPNRRKVIPKQIFFETSDLAKVHS